MTRDGQYERVSQEYAEFERLVLLLRQVQVEGLLPRDLLDAILLSNAEGPEAIGSGPFG